MLSKAVASLRLNANHELIIGVARALSFKGQADFFGQPGVTEKLSISFSVSPARFCPVVQSGQFHAQHRGLKRIKPTIDAHLFVKIFWRGAVGAQDAEAFK